MKKRHWALGGAVLTVLLCGALGWQTVRSAPVETVEIVPASVSLPLGVEIGLQVRGYTADGRLVRAERLEKLDLLWSYRADDDAFTVSEDGVVTPLAPGTGNVWVESGDGRLSSRPVTVRVK